MAERISVKLPEKFLCRVCAKWKGKTQFSNKELEKFTYRNQKQSTQVTPITAKLRCRVCAGGSAIEMECLGPCAETKPLSDFSKAARKAGGSNWCKLCTLWKESSDYNVSVQPPPSSVERSTSLETSPRLSSQLNDYEYSDPEAGNDDGDSDYDDISYISVSTASLGIAPSNTEDYDSQTSVSNQWENESYATTTTIVSQDLQRTAYSAWDPHGNRHRLNQQNLDMAGTSTLSFPENEPDERRPSNSRSKAWKQEPKNTSKNYTGKSSRQDASEDLIDL